MVYLMVECVCSHPSARTCKGVKCLVCVCVCLVSSPDPFPVCICEEFEIMGSRKPHTPS